MSFGGLKQHRPPAAEVARGRFENKPWPPTMFATVQEYYTFHYPHSKLTHVLPIVGVAMRTDQRREHPVARPTHTCARAHGRAHTHTYIHATPACSTPASPLPSSSARPRCSSHHQGGAHHPQDGTALLQQQQPASGRAGGCIRGLRWRHHHHRKPHGWVARLSWPAGLSNDASWEAGAHLYRPPPTTTATTTTAAQLSSGGRCAHACRLVMRCTSHHVARRWRRGVERRVLRGAPAWPPRTSRPAVTLYKHSASPQGTWLAAVPGRSCPALGIALPPLLRLLLPPGSPAWAGSRRRDASGGGAGGNARGLPAARGARTRTRTRTHAPSRTSRVRA